MLARPAHLASRLAGATATRWRYAGGGRNEYGEWDRGVASTATINLSSAPDDGRERSLSNDGARLEATRHFWTPDTLQAASDDGDGDVLRYDGEWWRIVQVDQWGDFYAAMATRIEGQDARAGTPPVDSMTGDRVIDRILRRHVALGAGLFETDAMGDIVEQYCIPWSGPGPAPKRLHAVLHVSRDEQDGEPGYIDEQGMSDPTVTQTAVISRTATATLEFRRDGAVDALDTFRQWAESNIAKRLEEYTRVTIHRHSFDMSRTDQIIGDRFEERASLTLHVGYYDVPTADAGAICDAMFALYHDDNPTEAVPLQVDVP